MSRMTGGRIMAALAVGLMLLVSPLRAADGKLTVVEKFGERCVGLAVAHFTAANVERSKSRVGLVIIASPDENSFAFDLAEWRTLIALCDKAIATQSNGWTGGGS